jgi:hypothetical protein
VVQYAQAAYKAFKDFSASRGHAFERQCCSARGYVAPRSNLNAGELNHVEGASENEDCKLDAVKDRRTNVRYPCRLCLSWRMLDPPLKQGESSIGTLNISSKGLLFSALEQFECGRLLEITLDWPARLNREIPLKLVILGNVLRSSDGYTAMTINQYEVRTRRHAALSLAHESGSHVQHFEAGSSAAGRPPSTGPRIVWRRKIHLPVQ